MNDNLFDEDLHKYDAWNNMAENLSYGIWVVAALVAVGYFLRLASVSGNKNKYDFINKYEVKLLWIASIILIVGACFYFNSGVVKFSTVLFFVRAFVTIAFGMIAALVIQNLLNFYYPFFIEKRLRVLRYKPRISPKTGKPMKLLSEEEEDVHLDEGMQAEENAFSVDYDVWKDEETGFIQIEKYAGHLHAIQCPECNYQTFKVAKEEISKIPTFDEEGEVIKHYICGYCGYKARKTVVLKKQTKQAGAPAAV